MRVFLKCKALPAFIDGCFNIIHKVSIVVSNGIIYKLTEVINDFFMHRENPFSITENKKLLIDRLQLQELDDGEMRDHFFECIKATFTGKQNELFCESCAFIIDQSLRLCLYDDKASLFIRVYDKLLSFSEKR